MICFSRKDIEQIAGQILCKYRQLPELQGISITKIDPTLLAERVMNLTLDFVHLSLSGRILGLTCFDETGVEVYDETDGNYIYWMDGNHNLLTGKLYCIHCGRPYYRKNSNTKTNHSNSTWRCSGKTNNGADSCPSCSLFENELLPVIETTFLESHNNIRTLSSRMLKLTEEILRSEDHTEQIISLNHDIEQEKKKKQKLLQYNIDGQISDAEYLCQLACCNREIDNLQEKISVLSENTPQNQDLSLKLVKAYAILLFAENNLAPEEIDSPFVDRFIREILVTADGNTVRLEIHLNTGTTVIKEIVRSEKYKDKKHYTTLQPKS